ncbi:MAG TPA: tetratricopeptide repeat protein [Thermoplasmata archaeon]|nr:tetratricopeptide repeat protein [Thermoplasmata archaeon]
MAEESSSPIAHEELARRLISLAEFGSGLPPSVTIRGDADESRKSLREFVRDDSGPVPALRDASAYSRLAALALALGLAAESSALADRALALDPSSAPARLSKAASLIAAGNHKKAIGVLDEAIKRDSRLGAAHLMKARSLLAREMPERALDSYKAAFAAEPTPESLVEAGGCWLALGDPEKAERLFAEARARFASDPAQVVKSSRGLASEARAHRLQPVLKGLLRSFPDDSQMWLEMARLYRDLKEPDRAVRCFEKALALGAEGAVKGELDAATAEMRDRLRCPACDGSGRCAGCKDGSCGRCLGKKKCEECDGKGACPGCDGSEKCPACAGKGKVGLMTKCVGCDGNGDCAECDDGKCPSCGTSGDCPGCAGGGNCVECGGAAKCRICKGSGMARAAA